MDRQDDTGSAGEYASSSSVLREADPRCSGRSQVPIAPDWPSVARWRRSDRERLIGARLAIAAADRQQYADRIVTSLDDLIGSPSGRILSLYWPFRGEPDLRPWMLSQDRRGGRCCLPVVVSRHQAVVFRLWTPGARLERGVWNIPVPADGPEVIPDVVIAPLVGFDGDFYRLGYGGGYYDRTLAAIPRKPITVGVGYAEATLETIHPQPHDIPMDAIVTERGVVARPPNGPAR
jgi:5-formyltetrahydrofolate cyclo-ligase